MITSSKKWNGRSGEQILEFIVLDRIRSIWEPSVLSIWAWGIINIKCICLERGLNRFEIRDSWLSGLPFDDINLLHLVFSLFLSVSSSPTLHPGCHRRGRDGTGNFAKARQVLSSGHHTSTPSWLASQWTHLLGSWRIGPILHDSGTVELWREPTNLSLSKCLPFQKTTTRTPQQWFFLRKHNRTTWKTSNLSNHNYLAGFCFKSRPGLCLSPFLWVFQIIRHNTTKWVHLLQGMLFRVLMCSK